MQLENFSEEKLCGFMKSDIAVFTTKSQLCELGEVIPLTDPKSHKFPLL